MTSEIWAALIVAVSAVLVAWMQTRTHREVKQTRAAAEQAVTQTEPIADGFADGINQAVSDIENHLARQDRRRDRIERETAKQITNIDDRLIKIEDVINPDSD